MLINQVTKSSTSPSCYKLAMNFARCVSKTGFARKKTFLSLKKCSTLPFEGETYPAIICNKVDLPEPLYPVIATASP